MEKTGYIAEDNSGRGNIFPSLQKPFVSSPTSDQAASQGLGGPAGIAILGAGVAVVLLATIALSQNAGGVESIEEVVSQLNGDSLSTIASRISASL